MKRYFLYELKKARWQLIIISAICVLLCATIAAVWPMRYESYDYINDTYEPAINTPMLSLVTLLGSGLCYIAPVLVYSFKMNKRCVDCYYALPLKKEKQYFVRTIIGLLLVIIPFTAAYWATFFVYLLRPNNPYNMGWFVPLYFGALFFIVCLFGYNAFAYTRANSIIDGIVFMIAYESVMILVALVPFVLSRGELFSPAYLLDFLPEWGMEVFTLLIEGYILKGQSALADAVYGIGVDAMTFIMPFVRGAAGYALMFFLLRKEKAEDSQQVCESWFGYKTLIPIYTSTIIGLIVGLIGASSFSLSLVVFVMFAIAAFVLIIVWRRKFVFGKVGWIVYGISLGAAIVLAVLVRVVFEWPM